YSYLHLNCLSHRHLIDARFLCSIRDELKRFPIDSSDQLIWRLQSTTAMLANLSSLRILPLEDQRAYSDRCNFKDHRYARRYLSVTIQKTIVPKFLSHSVRIL